MSATRPTWCPERKCRPLGQAHGKVCAGVPGDTGRLCCRFGQDLFAYDRLTAGDISGLRDLLDLLDDARIAREEGAAHEN
jgi:hypothetical protein